MSAAHLTVANIAKILGGDERGDEVLAPGPGHSDRDRSLSVKPDEAAPEGFLVHSFAYDDPTVCRDYVRKKLGLPEPTTKANGGSKSWTLISEHVYRTAAGQPYLRVCKKIDHEGKKQYPQSHWDGHGWIRGAPTGSKIPYRLPQLIGASPTAVVYFPEGEKNCDDLAKLGFIATTQSGGASAPWDNALTQHFRNRHVVVLCDADKVGRRHAQKVAKALDGAAASVRVLDLYPDRTDGSDVSDWLADDTAGVKLTKLAKEAPLWEPSADGGGDEVGDDKCDAEITRLAKLSALQYEQERKGTAGRLKVRASILDRLVEAERANLGLDQSAGKQGQAISFPEPEPWPQPVNGVALLDEIAAAIGRYVVMPEHARDTAALWAVHSYLLDQFQISPRLAIRSPVKRCGKTTLLDVLSRLVFKPLPTANVTAAALFRVVEMCRPCLLIDEADTFLAERDELRGVLNSGHRKGGSVLRTVGDDHEVHGFSTYAACTIALIGKLPDTLADRSVTVELKGRLPSETITSFRPDRAAHLDVLARQAARWVQDNAARVAGADPAMPAGIFNRDADNWRPLLTIADVAGGPWPERARNAVTHGHAEEEEASRIETLLGDIRGVFTERGVDRIASVDLAASLVGIEGRPWAEYGRSGKQLTPNQLARLLKGLAIAPEAIRIGTATPRGYRLSQFKEHFDRYLDSEAGAEPQQCNKCDEISPSDAFQTATSQPDAAVEKCQNPSNDGLCCGVAVAKGGLSEDQVVELANWYQGRAEADEDDPAALDAGLRQAVAEQVSPEQIDCELARVMGCIRSAGLKPAEPTKTQRRPPYVVVGTTPPNTTCTACHSSEGEVRKIRRNEPGSKTETLHWECAAGWFQPIDRGE